MKPHHMHYRYNLCTSNREGATNIQYQTSHPHIHEASQLSDNNRMNHPSLQTNQPFFIDKSSTPQKNVVKEPRLSKQKKLIFYLLTVKILKLLGLFSTIIVAK